MCKHDRLAVSRVVFPDSMEIKRVFCLNCGKTKTEIDLEQLLTAARDELAERNKVIEIQKMPQVTC